MRNADHAIMMTPTEDGWSWQLVDRDGCTARSGSASDQELALQLAWREAKALADFAGDRFPEIVVGYMQRS